MRRVIKWSMHFPGGCTVTAEYADDNNAEDHSRILDTVDAHEYDNEEMEHEYIQASAGHDASVYSNSLGAHTSDILWASEVMKAEMEEAVNSRLRVFARAGAIEHQSGEHGIRMGDEEGLEAPILQEMLIDQKREKIEKQADEFELACAGISRQYADMLCRDAHDEAAREASQEMLLNSNNECSIEFGRIFHSFLDADVAIRLWAAQSGALRVHTQSKSRKVYICRDCSIFGKRVLWTRNGVQYVTLLFSVD